MVDILRPWELTLLVLLQLLVLLLLPLLPLVEIALGVLTLVLVGSPLNEAGSIGRWSGHHAGGEGSAHEERELHLEGVMM